MLIICPNLAVDRTLTLDRLERGGVSRARAVTAVAGGKGVNAARVALALGGDPLLVGFAGGANGDALARGLESDRIPCRLVPVRGETRLTVALVEADGTATLVNEPGPEVNEEDCMRLVETAVKAARPGETVLVTGSVPPGALPTLYRQLIAALAGHDVVVDAGGHALEAALTARPFLVKPNREEAAPRCAKDLVAAGARYALVTDGPRDAVFAGDGEFLRLTPPQVEVVNPLGSGDALAGALLTALEGSASLRDALRFGIAAAADNARHLTAGCVDPECVRELAAML